MGKIARITNDKKLLIKGKFIVGIGEIDGSIIPDEEFTTVGTHSFTVPEGVTSIDYVVIAGGGGAGGSNNSIRASGGGGAGGVLIGTMPISSTSYEVIVGDGGIGGTGQVNGQNGSNSSLGDIIAIGGGGGGWADNGGGRDGNDGGSGGGAGAQSGIAGISILGQGNDGGNTTGAGLGRGGAGGGGATSAGQDGMSNLGGNGGAGIEINGQWYAGGGGGGQSGGGLGGSGVGGKGDGSNAVANTGSGGGGINGVGATGGNGSSGVVFIYYKNIRKPVTTKLTASGNLNTGEIIEYPAELEGRRNLFSGEFYRDINNYDGVQVYRYHLTNLDSNKRYACRSWLKEGEVAESGFYITLSIGHPNPNNVGAVGGASRQIISKGNTTNSAIGPVENLPVYITYYPPNTDPSVLDKYYISIQQLDSENISNWTPAPEDLGLEYSSDIQNFSFGIKEDRLMVTELIENAIL